MKTVTLTILLSSICFCSFGQNNRDVQIDAIMRATVIHEGKKPIHNFMLYAKNQPAHYAVHRGLGIVGRNENEIDANYQFKIASITKTFVAVLCIQLIEEGKLRYDDRISEYLRDLDFLNFEELHIYEKESYSDSVTVKHLLQHTSGLADLFEDSPFILNILMHKKRAYTPPEVVRRYYSYKLNKKTVNKPGQGYHYSDMNYTLLGFIIERVTGKSFAQALREKILEPLGLKDTYFEYYEPSCGIDKQVDTYNNRLNITQKVNTSYEWGGGGLVSTTRDLSVFIESLFELKLFKNPASLEQMIDLTPKEKFGKGGGMGIFQYEINGMKFFGHGGFYGSLLLYEPHEKLTLCVNISQANAALDPNKLIGDLVSIIAD